MTGEFTVSASWREPVDEFLDSVDDAAVMASLLASVLEDEAPEDELVAVEVVVVEDVFAEMEWHQRWRERYERRQRRRRARELRRGCKQPNRATAAFGRPRPRCRDSRAPRRRRADVRAALYPGWTPRQDLPFVGPAMDY